MEDAKPAQTTVSESSKLEENTEHKDRPPSSQSPSDPPPPPPPQPPVESKKRKLVNVDIKNHSYFKICALVTDLRPYIIEVLRTPDFKNSKAAHEIRKQMKNLLDLYNQMTAETAPVEDLQKPQGNHTLTGERKPVVALGEKNAENVDIGRVQGVNVIGGSNFGWNFIMYPSGEAIYYGVTKESFRSKK